MPDPETPETPATASLGDVLRAGRDRLAAAGVPDAMRDARRLMAHALDRPAAALIGAERDPVDAPAAAAFLALIARREAREPVARILGARAFWGHDFRITPAVLDPRPDSETLVAAALDRLPDGGAPARILDLGVGSGCLLLSLLAERPAARGLGLDRDPAAAAVATENARRLGLESRALIAVAHWSAAAAGPFDAVLANPPYIPTGEIDALAPEVARHDPRGALDGGPDGLAAYRALAAALPGLLAAGGAAYLEIGAGQADDVAALMRATGLAVPAVHSDLGGIPRCVVVTPADRG